MSLITSVHNFVDGYGSTEPDRIVLFSRCLLHEAICGICEVFAQEPPTVRHMKSVLGLVPLHQRRRQYDVSALVLLVAYYVLHGHVGIHWGQRGLLELVPADFAKRLSPHPRALVCHFDNHEKDPKPLHAHNTVV